MFFVERIGGKVWCIDIAGKHLWPLDAKLVFIVIGYQLYSRSGHGQADASGAVVEPMNEGSNRPGFRRAYRGRQHNPAPLCLFDKAVESVPGAGGQGSPCIEPHLHIFECLLSRWKVFFQNIERKVIGPGYIEKQGRLNLAHILDGFFNQFRRGPAFIKIVGAAVGEHDIEIEVGAERVAPWQPRQKLGLLVQ